MARPTKNRRTNSLTKKQRIAEVKALKEQGYTYKQVEEITGLAHQTIANYLKINDETVDKIKQVIKRHNLEYDNKTADLARQRILERLSDDKQAAKTRLYEITGVYKTARDLQEPKTMAGNTQAVQVNINIDTKKGSYIIDG
jgi:cyanate lyase